jgi:hypothetical protein
MQGRRRFADRRSAGRVLASLLTDDFADRQDVVGEDGCALPSHSKPTTLCLQLLQSLACQGAGFPPRMRCVGKFPAKSTIVERLLHQVAQALNAPLDIIVS